ncbi:MAG TPA: rhodanese-like domain-containing protein [Flavobacteriaceae bacterium]|nr:rhodanese-like domain-containing protein [Flavobacteriaceae bacterium]
MSVHFKKLFVFAILLSLTSCINSKKDPAVQVISPEQMANDLLEKEEIQLVDVRTSEEFLEGHLKNAQNICIASSDFEDKIKLLDKNKPVYLYCRTGVRSSNAAKTLLKMGFTEVYDMQGGITNWEEQGLELAE